jgi:exocyst complex component 6
LFKGNDELLWKETIASEEHKQAEQQYDHHQHHHHSVSVMDPSKKLANLEQTPFGKRATIFLPKIEAEVLMSAKRGLNRWFAALRSGGDGAKAGRAALRDTAHSAAAGPGALGLGGTLPASFLWRAQMADNWMARTTTASSKVGRACRLGYWFDRDAPKDADKLLLLAASEGSERYAEAIAVAFGWYRCWEDGSSLLIDPSEYAVSDTSNNINATTAMNMDGSMRGSRHGGLSGSRHGARSRHGPSKPKTLGFRASTNSRSQAYQEITSTLGARSLTTNQTSMWAEFLVPAILLSKLATRSVFARWFALFFETAAPTHY